MKRDKRVQSKQSKVMISAQKDFDDVEDLGVESERQWSSRKNAREFDFDDIPGSEKDTMSDLNILSHNKTVDSIGGDDATSDAGDISDFDTITDSNTLTSPSLISGAFPSTKRKQLEGRDTYADGTNRNEVDAIVNPEHDSLGMVDESDTETVAKYERAYKKDKERIKHPLPTEPQRPSV